MGQKEIIPSHVLKNAKDVPGPGEYFNKDEDSVEKMGTFKKTKGAIFGVSRDHS